MNIYQKNQATHGGRRKENMVSDDTWYTHSYLHRHALANRRGKAAQQHAVKVLCKDTGGRMVRLQKGVLRKAWNGEGKEQWKHPKGLLEEVRGPSILNLISLSTGKRASWQGIYPLGWGNNVLVEKYFLFKSGERKDIHWWNELTT